MEGGSPRGCYISLSILEGWAVSPAWGLASSSANLKKGLVVSEPHNALLSPS